MTLKHSIFAFLVATSAIAIPSLAYILMFGVDRVPSHEKWGQFGDFFGGVLNPIFAMLAFFVLLWAISIQLREFKSASDILNEQLDAAKTQVDELRGARVKDDLIHVVEDIDSRIEANLKVIITEDGSVPVLNIAHMAREAQRLRTRQFDSPAYTSFLTTAKTSGSVAESSARELTELLAKMRAFLQLYSSSENTSFSPIIIYYADKSYQLVDLLEDIGTIAEDTRKFFATISDHHG